MAKVLFLNFTWTHNSVDFTKLTYLAQKKKKLKHKNEQILSVKKWSIFNGAVF